MIKKNKNNFGLTLIELLVVIGILMILASMFITTSSFFRKEWDLNNNTEKMIATLRYARNKTLASEKADRYGVHFDTTTSPHRYTLFKGSDYTSRDISFDKVYQLSETIEIHNISLGGGNEVVFDRITGVTDQSGSVSLRLKTNFAKNKDIYIDVLGQVSLNVPSVLSNGRIKDSRHVHFDYSRAINTATERLTLILDAGVPEEIIIADYLKEGQIYWEGEVDVGSDIQKLKIHTHRLNDPDTQFCIHRDRRYNNKSLYIDISGDGGATPNLISYTLDGQTTKGFSIYVSEPAWQ